MSKHFITTSVYFILDQLCGFENATVRQTTIFSKKQKQKKHQFNQVFPPDQHHIADIKLSNSQ